MQLKRAVSLRDASREVAQDSKNYVEALKPGGTGWPGRQGGTAQGLVFAAIAHPQDKLVAPPDRPPASSSPQKSEPLSLCWVCSCVGRGEGEGLRQRRREPLRGALR